MTRLKAWFGAPCLLLIISTLSCLCYAMNPEELVSTFDRIFGERSGANIPSLRHLASTSTGAQAAPGHPHTSTSFTTPSKTLFRPVPGFRFFADSATDPSTSTRHVFGPSNQLPTTLEPAKWMPAALFQDSEGSFRRYSHTSGDSLMTRSGSSSSNVPPEGQVSSAQILEANKKLIRYRTPRLMTPSMFRRYLQGYSRYRPPSVFAGDRALYKARFRARNRYRRIYQQPSTSSPSVEPFTLFDQNDLELSPHSPGPVLQRQQIAGNSGLTTSKDQVSDVSRSRSSLQAGAGEPNLELSLQTGSPSSVAETLSRTSLKISDLPTTFRRPTRFGYAVDPALNEYVQRVLGLKELEKLKVNLESDIQDYGRKLWGLFETRFIKRLTLPDDEAGVKIKTYILTKNEAAFWQDNRSTQPMLVFWYLPPNQNGAKAEVRGIYSISNKDWAYLNNNIEAIKGKIEDFSVGSSGAYELRPKQSQVIPPTMKIRN